jgi:hypothetical protein
MENRRARRRAAAIARQNRFFSDYVAHLPILPIGAPIERGRVYHQVIYHDSWCSIYDGGACNCSPDFSLHVEPTRS